MEKKNEFKFSVLRQFGSENISFTATIQSDKTMLSEAEIDQQVFQTDMLIRKAFIGVQEREISEKALLAEASERRRAEVAKLDEALKAEMKAKESAQKTMKDAERASKKLTK
jgi:hypothetical protein